MYYILHTVRILKTTSVPTPRVIRANRLIKTTVD